jgi:uncharacterized membrane protein (UPF0127 family)
MADRRCALISTGSARAIGHAALALCVASLVLAGCGNERGQAGAVPRENAAGGSAPTPTTPATPGGSTAGTGATRPPDNAGSPSAGAPSSAGPSSASSDAPGDNRLVRAVIAGQEFQLEAAVNNATRYRGLGGRESLPERGGMLFAFPFSERLEFVMRDCLIDIDIAYLDNDGVVQATHTMVIDPREEGESDTAYERRLVRYSSRYPSRFAVEVRAGLLRELGVQVGDVIEFDRESLKRRAR